MEGAAGFYLDNGIYLFGTYVEAEVREAGEGARDERFARSARERAFSRLMGDDMSNSTAGFADPFTSGAEIKTQSGAPARRADKLKDTPDGELLWSES